MKRTFLFAVLVLLLSYGAIQAQTPTVTSFPTLTPVPVSPPLPLIFSQVTHGHLKYIDDIITYRFEMPANVDMVVHYMAGGFVHVRICVETEGVPVCPEGGGGGDGPPDAPVADTLIIPSSDAAQTIQLKITRIVNSAIDYSLEVFPVAVSALGLDESRTVSDTTAKTPYASYILNVNPDQPFVVEIEDAQANGDYLWVAHHPFIDANFKASEVRQTYAQRIDAADREDNPKGVNSLELYYLGGNEFRVFVTAHGTFLLNSRSLNVQPLDAGVSLPLTISYRNPLAAVRLNADPGDVAKVDFQIPDGSRAVAEVYQEGGSIGDSLELGYSSNSRTTVPVTGMIHEVATERPLYALVQLGDGSTRDPLRVTLGWSKET